MNTIKIEKTVTSLPTRSSFVGRAALIAICATLFAPLQAFAQAPTFSTLAMTPVTVDSGFPENATVGDINGDGKLDAIIPGIGGLRVLLGIGDGTFVDQLSALADVTSSNVVNLHPSLVASVSSAPHPVGGVGSLRAVDVNGDGKLDLVCVTVVGINFTNFSFISVLINSGAMDANGVPLFNTTHYWVPFLGVRPVTVGDLNGDGQPEIIVGTGGGTIQVWLNNGSGGFSPGQVTSLTPGAGGPSVGQGVIADLNGDGKADYVVTSNQNGGANIFFGNGNGTFQTAVTYLPNQAVSVAVADVNGDNKPDLLMGDLTTGSEGLRVYLNNGSGTFGSPTVFPISGLAGFFAGGGSVAVADINGDGKLDAVLSNLGNNTIALLLGDGNGGFGTPATFQANVSPTQVFVGDFNGDGKPDIASVLRNSRSFGVLLNTTVSSVPPVITSLTSSVSSLWPPNGKMVPVTVQAAATGKPAPTCSISSVSSNEGSAVPSGPQSTITGPLAVNLKAERLGAGTGRIYSIVVTCTNAAGSTSQTVTVTVPHDQGK